MVVFRRVCFAIGFLLLWTSVALAQGDIPSGSREIDLAKWAITQGGLALVTLAILWSYRKDSAAWIETERHRAETEKAKNDELIGVIVANTTAMTTVSETVRNVSEELRLIRLK